MSSLFPRCVAPIGSKRCNQDVLGKMKFCPEHMHFTTRYKNYKFSHNYYNHICREKLLPPYCLNGLSRIELKGYHNNLLKRHSALNRMMTLRERYQKDCIHHTCWNQGHVLLHNILRKDQALISYELVRVTQSIVNIESLQDESKTADLMDEKQRPRSKTF